MSSLNETSSKDTPSTSSDTPPAALIVLTALVMAALVSNINISSAGVALPDIAVAFDASQTLLNFVAIGPGLGLSMSVVYFGALADRYGRKQLLTIGLIGLIVTSVISAFAPNITILIVARILAGIAGGMTFPTTLSLITALWAQGPKRTTAIAIWSGVSSMATVVGAVLAGLLLAIFWWGSAFLLSLPIALVALILVLRYVPSHVGETTEKLDHLSGMLVTLGIATLVLGVSIILTPHGLLAGIVLFVIAVVTIGLFLFRQSRITNPLYDLAVAQRKTFWAPAVAGAIVLGGLSGAIYVGTQFMQNILGYSPLDAGLAVVPAALGLLVMTPLAPRLLLNAGTRQTLLIGYGIVLIAFITMLFWREHTPYWLIGVGFFAIGAGASFVATASSRSLTNSTPVRRVGMASATSDLQSDLGGAVMQSILGAILASGFAQAFHSMIEKNPQSTQISDSAQNALQASYASAMQVAKDHPQYADPITEAAKQSFLDGTILSYVVGGTAILIGIVVVFFVVPNQTKEHELLKEYAEGSDAA